MLNVAQCCKTFFMQTQFGHGTASSKKLSTTLNICHCLCTNASVLWCAETGNSILWCFIWWPCSSLVAYASRSLTKTEQRYAQIEKELIGVLFACKKFHDYTIGKHMTVETDHKPLETILKKPLLSAPMRLQRMMLQLQRYDMTVGYKKGSQMFIADTLSRA